jgi:NADP-dependent 3-hydroxy acid dehydrogenase YdfG
VLDGRAFNIACGQIDIGNATTDMSARMATGAMQANGTTMVEPRIPAKLVAEAVVHMANLPLEANIPFVTIMASGMPLYGRG